MICSGCHNLINSVEGAVVLFSFRDYEDKVLYAIGLCSYECQEDWFNAGGGADELEAWIDHPLTDYIEWVRRPDRESTDWQRATLKKPDPSGSGKHRDS